MAKNGNRPRHIRAVSPGEIPPDTAETLVDAIQTAVDEYKAQVHSIIDACDQVIVVGCVGGVIAAVHAMNPDRHNVMGALREAYDFAAYPGCDCEQD